MKNVVFIILVFVCGLVFIATDCSAGVNSNLSNDFLLTSLSLTYASSVTGDPDIVVPIDLPDYVVSGNNGYNTLTLSISSSNDFNSTQFGIESYTASESNTTLRYASLSSTNDRNIYADDSAYSFMTLSSIIYNFNVLPASVPSVQNATAYLFLESEDKSKSVYYFLDIHKTLPNDISTKKEIESMTVDFSKDYVSGSAVTVSGGSDSSIGTVIEATDTSSGLITFDSGSISDSTNIPSVIRIKAIVSSFPTAIYGGMDRDSAYLELNKGYGLTNENAGQLGFFDSHVRNKLFLDVHGSGSSQTATAYIIIVAGDGSQHEYNIQVGK